MSEGSHPPALQRRTERTLREETPLKPGERILVAISGGGDSVALLHVLARLAPRLGYELCAHGVDHGLRAAAAAELDLAEQLAKQLGVPFERSELRLAAGGNLQARAREARYAALDAAAERAAAHWVATAHHASDRAETLLLRLLRGSSPRALGVLPAAAERRLRPFIRSPKSAVSLHLERHGLSYANDPSNHDPRFLRTRIREELLPLLEQLTPGAARRLNLLADECTESSPVVVTDAQGHVVPLGRTQVAQIRRAHKLRQPGARIWLAGGHELELTRGGEASSEGRGVEQHLVWRRAETQRETNGRAYDSTDRARSLKKPRAAREMAQPGREMPRAPREMPRPAPEKPAERGAKPTKSD